MVPESVLPKLTSPFELTTKNSVEVTATLSVAMTLTVTSRPSLVLATGLKPVIFGTVVSAMGVIAPVAGVASLS